MSDIEQYKILVRPAASAFVDFGHHGARDHIARGQIFGIGRIALHESFALRIAQNAAFTAHAFGNQHPRSGNTGWMKLPELHVFQWYPRTRRHANTIAGIDECIGR